MTRVSTPQSRCRAGATRCDITPPVGIYHRMWGAALHDRATGVHRPLTATALWLEPRDPVGSASPASPSASQLVISLDHCILEGPEQRRLQDAISQAAGVPPRQIHLALTHTHGSGWMSRARSHLPGGELIGPYLDALAEKLAQLAVDARGRVTPATIVYGAGRSRLAAHRDFRDAVRGHAVCGFNPEGPADDTVLIGRVTSNAGDTLATLVNYACHPTTLAWDNTLLSPDWVGAMRETVEGAAGGLCLFLQGASGDLGPREGFVGDTRVADRNGRQLGYAALAALEALPSPGVEYRYAGPVLSGTWIGAWQHESLDAATLTTQASWQWSTITVDLPYRHDLPTVEQTTADRDSWQQAEEAARQAGDTPGVRDCRAKGEQMTRQLARLAALTPGRVCPLPVTIARLGEALWVFTPGELYQVFQTTLRARFAPRPVMVTTLCGDWQPGYIPPAEVYGYGIYQEVIAATAPGCLEVLIERISREMHELLHHERRRVTAC